MTFRRTKSTPTCWSNWTTFSTSTKTAPTLFVNEMYSNLGDPIPLKTMFGHLIIGSQEWMIPLSPFLPIGASPRGQEGPYRPSAVESAPCHRWHQCQPEVATSQQEPRSHQRPYLFWVNKSATSIQTVGLKSSPYKSLRHKSQKRHKPLHVVSISTAKPYPKPTPWRLAVQQQWHKLRISQAGGQMQRSLAMLSCIYIHLSRSSTTWGAPLKAPVTAVLPCCFMNKAAFPSKSTLVPSKLPSLTTRCKVGSSTWTTGIEQKAWEKMFGLL